MQERIKWGLLAVSPLVALLVLPPISKELHFAFILLHGLFPTLCMRAFMVQAHDHPTIDPAVKILFQIGFFLAILLNFSLYDTKLGGLPIGFFLMTIFPLYWFWDINSASVNKRGIFSALNVGRSHMGPKDPNRVIIFEPIVSHPLLSALFLSAPFILVFCLRFITDSNLYPVVFVLAGGSAIMNFLMFLTHAHANRDLSEGVKAFFLLSFVLTCGVAIPLYWIFVIFLPWIIERSDPTA